MFQKSTTPADGRLALELFDALIKQLLEKRVIDVADVSAIAAQARQRLNLYTAAIVKEGINALDKTKLGE